METPQDVRICQLRCGNTQPSFDVFHQVSVGKDLDERGFAIETPESWSAIIQEVRTIPPLHCSTMCEKGYMPQHTNTYTPQLQQEWFNTAEYAFPMQKKSSIHTSLVQPNSKCDTI